MPADHTPLPLFINQQPELDALCDRVAASDTIAFDTEFVRTRTYAPHLGLVQIAAGDAAVCVDPLAELDYTRFWQLLFDPARAVIMHSASQDLEVLWFHTGTIVHNLIDTQTCAALLGYPPQIGYAALVEDLAGVTLSKEHTRTDWTRRPLGVEQIDYAAKDVVYLDGMHSILRERLDALGRYDWAVEDSRLLCRTELYKPDPANAWQRLKSIPMLPGREQARARALAAWREQRAVELDKPRRWVLDDKALLNIAAATPTSTAALARVPEVPDGLARRQGDTLLAVLSEADANYAADPDAYRQEIPDRDADKALSNKLGRIVRATADELELPAEVVGSRREITAYMRGQPSRLTAGWRDKLMGEQLRAALAA